MLSSHYQGTPYDPYASYGDKQHEGCLPLHRHQPQRLYGPACRCVPTCRRTSRASGVDRLRLQRASTRWCPSTPTWTRTPAYLANTTGEVSTDSFYWASRMIAAMADASYAKSLSSIWSGTRRAVLSASRALLNQYDSQDLGRRTGGPPPAPPCGSRPTTALAADLKTPRRRHPGQGPL